MTFFYLDFHSCIFMINRIAEEGGGYLFNFYHFHPFHRGLDISQMITAESSSLQIASSLTQTRSLRFPSTSCYPLSDIP